MTLWRDDIDHVRRGQISHLRSIWHNVKQRCNNPNSTSYRTYGGRGIKMHPPWEESFELFMKDVGLRPSPELSLDRIENDGNYEPGNVRWATAKQQVDNRRKQNEAGGTTTQVS
jgi:hypothetical protein